MGFDDATIVLDSPNNTYYSGQTVHGKLIFERDRVKKFRGIYVRMRGFCKVHWTETKTRRVNDRRETYTVTHESYEEYFDQKQFLAGSGHGESHISAGKHVFPFNIHIPERCPSAFEGSHGHIRYELKVVVDRAFKTDQEISVPIRVMAPLDLNKEPDAKEPIEIQMDDVYCCWCVSSGSSETLVKMPVSGFCPGQMMMVEVSCANRSNVDIEKIKLAVKKEITFHATNNPGTKQKRDTVMEVQKGPIPGNSTRNWTVELEVPAMDVYNLRGCSYIDLVYEFKVTVSPEGCHDDSDDSCEIIFGTIPLIGYQDNVLNPMRDQMPQPLAPPMEAIQSYPGAQIGYPIVNQPLSNIQHPGTGLYPGNVSYPSPNPPYPGSPFPNSPYPGQNQTTPSPYPGNSPYPAPSPYPATNSPYPATNSPYPATNSPYPATNSPYPGANQTTSPYPVTSSYSNQPSPYTNEQKPQSVPLLKTGTFGFVTGSDTTGGANMPLLPPGASVPRVTVSPKGCRDDSDDSCEIIFGTIPLIDYRDNVLNPIQIQMPQPLAPPMETTQSYPGAQTGYPISAVNQPLPNIQYPGTGPHPGNVSYPSPNPPYPGAPNSSNPTTNPPYPAPNSSKSTTNPPYPAPNSSNPTTNTPYPAPNSSNPTTNPPYPAPNSSNPTTNPPYPIPNSSNPTTNPPYPAPNLSNPTTNPPYPAPNSSNPTTNPPYPALNSSNPTTNPPYPAANSLNSTTNPPYPALNSSNPTTNPPYPAPTSSNPTTNPPYPATNSPNPTTNPPYPAPNSSNPTTNPPYPAPNSSNPTTNPPYPATNSPNPTTNPPYPAPNSSNPTTNPRYPAPNSSNPTTNPPYPAPNSPNPTTNPPYPVTNSSNPTTNPPYPAPNSPNPTTNPPYPVTNSSNPTANPPYPAPNSPNPTTNPPYPATNSPNPTTNPPYPAPNSPNPTTNPPYLAPNSPNPTTIPLYQATNSLYPATNPPYPATNSPNSTTSPPFPAPNSSNPTTNPPIPAPNSSNPTTNPPYPGANQTTSPYPVTSSYSNQPSLYTNKQKPLSVSLLKTGIFGFIMGSDTTGGASMPLLPLRSSVPMPRPVSPANTYAASAPEPSTPDDDKKPPQSENSENSEKPPAYNPAFASSGN